MSTQYKTTTHAEATNRGFVAITSPYNPDEHSMLDKALELLQGITYMLVTSFEGISIYRKQKEVNVLKEVNTIKSADNLSYRPNPVR